MLLAVWLTHIIWLFITLFVQCLLPLFQYIITLSVEIVSYDTIFIYPPSVEEKKSFFKLNYTHKYLTTTPHRTILANSHYLSSDIWWDICSYINCVTCHISTERQIMCNCVIWHNYHIWNFYRFCVKWHIILLGNT